MDNNTKKFIEEYKKLCEKYGLFVGLPPYVADYVVIRKIKSTYKFEDYLSTLDEE